MCVTRKGKGKKEECLETFNAMDLLIIQGRRN